MEGVARLPRWAVFQQCLWKTLDRAEATPHGQASWLDHQQHPRQHFFYLLPLPQGQGSFRLNLLLGLRKDGCSLA
jgi:hypothetical protein